jgi:hypothetical protein
MSVETNSSELHMLLTYNYNEIKSLVILVILLKIYQFETHAVNVAFCAVLDLKSLEKKTIKF